MDFDTTVDLIIKDLEEARQIIDDLKNYPGVPVLQIELAKSKCRSAAEIITLLKNIQNQVPATGKDNAGISGEEVSTPAEKKEKQEKQEVQEIQEKQVEEKVNRSDTGKKESTTIGDSYGLTDRLNEQMGSMRGNDNVTEIIKTKPLANLDDAIGVNDKFLFIREIFNGSPESYDQALQKLNSIKTFTEARDILLSYSDDNKETKVLKQFLDIVKRKFPGNE